MIHKNISTQIFHAAVLQAIHLLFKTFLLSPTFALVAIVRTNPTEPNEK